MKKIFFIWIGWIWISAVARYYKSNWYEVVWSSDSSSELIGKLESEWINIHIWHSAENLPADTEMVIYTEAIFSKNDNWKLETKNPEFNKAKDLDIETLSYPEALAKIVNSKKCIAVAWSHWKSTTTSILWITLMWSEIWWSTIVWTQVPQFKWSNFHYEDSPYFAIEACEYRRSFLMYKPYMSIITNIDLDHLDYFRDLEDYISAFQSLCEQTGDYIVISWDCENSKKLKLKNKKVIRVFDDHFIDEKWEKHEFEDFVLKVPWEHIAHDAKLVYAACISLWMDSKDIISKLESYAWAWRRSEIVKITWNWNILLSDYWHHPTEIKLTLDAIKSKYPEKRLIVAFQPHQYSRTIELLEWFKKCFSAADELIIPNIYFSRDSEEDVKNMNTDILVAAISENHNNVTNWQWLKNASEILKEKDSANIWNAIIVLLWAWDIDDLRNKLN